MYVGQTLSAMDVLNISVSGFLIVFAELAILFGFIYLMVWLIGKIQNTRRP